MNNKACKYIISLIRTIPISVHKGQHALLLADNSAESIALYGFFLKNNVPLILLNASMRDEQVQEYMDEYRPQWFVYPKNRNLPQYSGGQNECSENRKRYQCYETACEWNGYVIASRGNAGFELTYHWLEDLALLIPTSGSTGGRRLVMLTKANLAANAKSIAESLRMDCTERSAVLMPLMVFLWSIPRSMQEAVCLSRKPIFFIRNAGTIWKKTE